MLVEANINTIRTYAAITNVAELNAFANAGIRVIMMLNENSYTWYVNQFKDHPAILMWEFGNEFNYHPEWFSNNIQNWYNILENCAATVKSLDPNHPVSTGHGEVPNSQALNSCPSVDVWGMNIYRWLSPDSAINDLASITDKAMYISEAGADSFNTNSNSENQAQQAQATEIILNSIIQQSDLCVGVTLFEFCDEWWKAGNPNQQDPGGFSNAIPYDNFANEEYWGIVTRDRVPKLSYYVVQEIYESTSLSIDENFIDINVYPNPVSDGFLNIINPSNRPLNISIYDLNVDVVAEDNPSTLIDGDSVLNPGESATIYIQLENELGWVDASNLTAYLSTENEYIQIDDDLAVYGSLQNGSIDEGSFEISVSEMADLGEIEFNLSVQATGVNYDYENNLSFNIDISLFQEGFPYDINTEVRASSVVAD